MYRDNSYDATGRDAMLAEDAMNAEEVARYLQIGKNSVYQLAKSGRLASYHIGRKLRFTLSDVDAYIASTRTEAQAAPGGGDAGDAAHVTIAPLDQGSGQVGYHASTQTVAQAAAPRARDAFVVAGNDVAADLLANALSQAGLPMARAYRSSYASLVNAYAGEADAAVIHLFDRRTNTYNVPYVQRLMPGVSSTVVRLYRRRQGFVVAEGNPKHLGTWGSLLHEGVRLANQELGSGSRVLLDEKLRSLDARADAVLGYDDAYATARIAAERVAAGAADVALAPESVTHLVRGVAFVPLQTEEIAVAVAKTPRTRQLVRQVKSIAADAAFQRRLARIDGASIDGAGDIVFES